MRWNLVILSLLVIMIGIVALAPMASGFGFGETALYAELISEDRDYEVNDTIEVTIYVWNGTERVNPGTDNITVYVVENGNFTEGANATWLDDGMYEFNYTFLNASDYGFWCFIEYFNNSFFAIMGVNLTQMDWSVEASSIELNDPAFGDTVQGQVWTKLDGEFTDADELNGTIRDSNSYELIGYLNFTWNETGVYDIFIDMPESGNTSLSWEVEITAEYDGMEDYSYIDVEISLLNIWYYEVELEDEYVVFDLFVADLENEVVEDADIELMWSYYNQSGYLNGTTNSTGGDRFELEFDPLDWWDTIWVGGWINSSEHNQAVGFDIMLGIETTEWGDGNLSVIADTTMGDMPLFFKTSTEVSQEMTAYYREEVHANTILYYTIVRMNGSLFDFGGSFGIPTEIVASGSVMTNAAGRFMFNFTTPSDEGILFTTFRSPVREIEDNETSNDWMFYEMAMSFYMVNDTFGVYWTDYLSEEIEINVTGFGIGVNFTVDMNYTGETAGKVAGLFWQPMVIDEGDFFFAFDERAGNWMQVSGSDEPFLLEGENPWSHTMKIPSFFPSEGGFSIVGMVADEDIVSSPNFFPTSDTIAGNWFVKEVEDDEAPTVVETGPADDETDVGIDVNPAVEFSEAMDRDSVEENVSVSPVASFDIGWEDGDTLMIIYFDSDLAEDEEYTISIDGGEDLYGNELEPYSWGFITEDIVENGSVDVFIANDGPEQYATLYIDDEEADYVGLGANESYVYYGTWDLAPGEHDFEVDGDDFGYDDDSVVVTEGGEHEVYLNLTNMTSEDYANLTVYVSNHGPGQYASLFIEDDNASYFWLDENVTEYLVDTWELDVEPHDVFVYGDDFGEDNDTAHLEEGGNHTVYLHLYDEAQPEGEVNIWVRTTGSDQNATIYINGTDESYGPLESSDDHELVDTFYLAPGDYSFEVEGEDYGYGIENQTVMDGGEYHLYFRLDPEGELAWLFINVTNHGWWQNATFYQDGVAVHNGTFNGSETWRIEEAEPIEPGNYTIALEGWDFGYDEFNVTFVVNETYYLHFNLYADEGRVFVFVDNDGEDQNATIYFDGVENETMLLDHSDDEFVLFDIYYLTPHNYTINVTGEVEGSDETDINVSAGGNYSVFLTLEEAPEEEGTVIVFINNNGEAQSGTLYVNGEEWDADEFDGNETIELNITLEPGFYTFKGIGDLFGMDEMTVEVEKDETIYINLTLQQPGKAKIMIYYNNVGPAQNATLTVNGNTIEEPALDADSGMTFIVTIFRKAGNYTFNLTGDEFGHNEQMLTVEADDDKAIVLVLSNGTRTTGSVLISMASRGPAQNGTLMLDDGVVANLTFGRWETGFPHDEYLDVEPGDHWFNLTGDSFGEAAYTLTVVADMDYNFDLELEYVANGTAKVYITNDGDAQRAALEVDGELFGSYQLAEDANEVLIATVELSPGEHEFDIEGQDFGDDDKTVTVVKGETIDVYLTLEAAPSTKITEKKTKNLTSGATLTYQAAIQGGGSLTILETNSPDANDTDDVDIFVDITLTKGTLVWLYIEVGYEGVVDDDEAKDLRIYYWDEAKDKWKQAELTGVNTVDKFVWANVTHLTIFAPRMKEAAAPSEGDDDKDDKADITTMAGIFILILIVIVILLLSIKRSGRKKKSKPIKFDEGLDDAAVGPKVEEEVVEEDDDAEYCPECGTEVFADEEECPECGVSLFEDDDGSIEECPDCGAAIATKSDKCPDCGAEL